MITDMLMLNPISSMGGVAALQLLLDQTPQTGHGLDLVTGPKNGARRPLNHPSMKESRNIQLLFNYRSRLNKDLTILATDNR